MINESKTSSTFLISAWSAGVALLFLGIGLHGATAPLLPPGDVGIQIKVRDDTVMVETFQPPAAAILKESLPEPETKEEDIEIPTLPEITPPLTPPEMVEITPLDEVRELPRPKPVKMKPAPRPPSRPASATGSNNAVNGSSPETFNRAGIAGRFPDPAYPASARAARQQGTVRLLVTVEASGIPSSVEITSSSGSGALDSAARDAISRRWRWPAGSVRKFIIPIRFVLQ